MSEQALSETGLAGLKSNLSEDHLGFLQESRVLRVRAWPLGPPWMEREWEVPAGKQMEKLTQARLREDFGQWTQEGKP